jgi:hypothetical protein
MAWCANGGSVSEFWSLTPRQFSIALRGLAKREEREQQRAAWLAWHNQALRRQKKLPDARRFILGNAARTAPVARPSAYLEKIADRWTRYLERL